MTDQSIYDRYAQRCASRLTKLQEMHDIEGDEWLETMRFELHDTLGEAKLLGFDRVARFNYFPGWHQTATMFDLIINKDTWKGMRK